MRQLIQKVVCVTELLVLLIAWLASPLIGSTGLLVVMVILFVVTIFYILIDYVIWDT